MVSYPMSKLKTPLEIYKVLPKTNCRDCGASTCLAFASAVIKQEKKLTECPHLDQDTISRVLPNMERPKNLEIIQEDMLRDLKEKICTIDIVSRAKRLGGRDTGRGTVMVTCLGKDFEIEASGAISSQCHTHAWFSVPLLNYVLFSEGKEPVKKWVPLRELEQGGKWGPLFEQRCERPLKQIADAHADLFEDLITMFSGASSADDFSSDIAVVLYPLPRVPILICYWRPEDDLESRLHVFFDATAEKNLPIESLFTLGTGIVRMLEKILMKHA